MTDTAERALRTRLVALGFQPDDNEHTLLDEIERLRTTPDTVGIRVIGTVYELHEEVFYVPAQLGLEAAHVKAEEMWIMKHGSAESLESFPVD